MGVTLSRGQGLGPRLRLKHAEQFGGIDRISAVVLTGRGHAAGLDSTKDTGSTDPSLSCRVSDGKSGHVRIVPGHCLWDNEAVTVNRPLRSSYKDRRSRCRLSRLCAEAVRLGWARAAA